MASVGVKHSGRVNAGVPDFGQHLSKPGAIRSFEAPGDPMRFPNLNEIHALR